MSTQLPPTTPSATSMKKTFHTTSNPYEKQFGYHRAVRKGPFIFVSGTTALDPTTGKIKHPNDAANQTIVAFREALKAVEALGGKKEDICRVRMFVGRTEDCEVVGRAFQGGFESTAEEAERTQVGCAATMIVVPGGFVSGEMVVEVEVDAVVG